MLLPLMGFTFTLIIVGALASLVAIGAPLKSRLTPFIGFPALLGGAGALVLSIALSFLGEALDHATGLRMLSGLGFFFGYATGGAGGAVSGFVLASRRVRKINF